MVSGDSLYAASMQCAHCKDLQCCLFFIMSKLCHIVVVYIRYMRFMLTIDVYVMRLNII